MDNLNQNIIAYLSAIFNQARSKGIQKLDTYKVIEYINNTFRVQLDPDNIDELISKIDIVSDINDKEITIAGKEKADEEQEAIDNVEDKASEQAMDDLTSESLIGKELDINKINLNESMEDYFILKGAKDNNVNLICCGLNKDTNSLKFRLKDKSIFVDINVEDL